MQTVSTSPSAKSMRRKADELRQRGCKRNSFWLTPSAIEVLDGARQRMKLDSREATINAILERIGTDVLLLQEFLAVTK